MEINLRNIEEIIFRNPDVWRHMPSMSHYRDEWMVAQRVPGMRGLGKRAVLGFLSKAGAEQIEAMEYHFGEPIVINKIDPSVHGNLECDIADLEGRICEFVDFGEVCISRNKETVKLSFWR